MQAWIMLGAAGLFEIVWAIGLKYADGFTKPVPSAITITAMDALNNVLPGYTDPVQLAFATPFASTPYLWIPAGTSPALPAAAKCRLQVLYLRSDLGGIRKLNALRCSGIFPSALTEWTVRVRNVSRTSLPALSRREYTSRSSAESSTWMPR